MSYQVIARHPDGFDQLLQIIHVHTIHQDGHAETVIYVTPAITIGAIDGRRAALGSDAKTNARSLGVNQPTLGAPTDGTDL